MFNLFRLCQKDEISFDIVGNNIVATFDFVEEIVRLVAFDNVASTLLLVWTGLNNQGREKNMTNRGFGLPLATQVSLTSSFAL